MGRERRKPRSSLALLKKVICLPAHPHSQTHINKNRNTLMDTHTVHFIDEIRERQRGREERRIKERQPRRQEGSQR